MRNATRLLAEATLVPAALFALLLHISGLFAALLAALAWCWFILAVRWRGKHRLPGTLLLSAGLLSVRCGVALATSSAFLYLMQPAIGSLVMAMFFLGSSFVGRPITLRLAQDFVQVPKHLLDRPRVRRMFRDVGILWGLSRIVDATLSLGLLQGGINAGILARGVVSPILLVLSIAACVYWGRRSLASDGIRLRRALPA